MTIGVAILDMDGTLLSKRSIDVFSEALGLKPKLVEADRLSGHLPAYKIGEMIAGCLRGTQADRLEELFDSIPLSAGAVEFVEFLRSKRFFIAIATDSYEFLAERLAKRIGADTVYGNLLEIQGGVATGRLLTEHRCLKIAGCREFATCKLWLMKALKSRIGGLTLAVGDGDSDFCAITHADLGVAYRPKSRSIADLAKTVVSDYAELRSLLQKELASRQN